MARLVTQRVELIKYTDNPEATIAAAAKLCYSCNPLNKIIENNKIKDNAKFIDMLIKMNHLSPLEHASFTFGVEGVSRALLAQITRHRIASFSVRSQRYVSEEEFGFILPPSIEKLGKLESGQTAKDIYIQQMQQIAQWYKEWQVLLGGKGESSNEDARFVLPNATETKIIFTMNARELLHFFTLRCCDRAQWEIRSLAWAMLQNVLKVAPSLFAKAGPGCVNTGCKEGAKACGRPKEYRDMQKKVKRSAKEYFDQSIKNKINDKKKLLEYKQRELDDLEQTRQTMFDDFEKKPNKNDAKKIKNFEVEILEKKREMAQLDKELTVLNSQYNGKNIREVKQKKLSEYPLFEGSWF